MNVTDPIFTDEAKARAHFEATRWPQGACCPFCGQFDTVKPLGGKSMGDGWYHCKKLPEEVHCACWNGS